MDQKPTVGRIVHFKDKKDSPCIAGMITEVDDQNPGVIEMTLFKPHAVMGWAKVGHESGNVLETMVGSWHWPERV